MKVTLPPEIDHHRAAVLRRVIDEALCLHRPTRLRMDGAGVEFMDSSGLGLLMGRYALMNRLGGEMILSCPSAAMLRMVHLAGMERLFCIEEGSNEKERSKHA